MTTYKLSMNKKVLIISSTPRKGGNSDKLCDAFAEGAKEAGMVCADGVYELGAIDGTMFLAEAKELGNCIR